ncbi:family 20 glycosylhydrolase [Thalassotalea psychrophila]|uniref:beta-N-acetylhexosaminidase n=1 Tax=Thalassotalea psychrophila TaxID=3065647 RepID=A0ABY9TQG6_9GAMM|nr:family 20 glycosylhydrolase [Colwelliaceae bacterium SQ149]
MNKIVALSVAASLALMACTDVNESSSNTLNQSQLDQLSNSLNVEYQLITNVADENCDPNRHDGACFQLQLNLTSPENVNSSDWEIYFSQINPVQSVDSKLFTIEHVNGDLHKIVPTANFTGFEAGQTYPLNYRVDFWSLSETDALPNYILSVDSLEPRVIKSTQTTIDAETGLEIYPFVKSFTSVEKHFKRTPTDQTQWATADVLFERNAKMQVANNELQSSLIPSPKRMDVTDNGLFLDLTNGIHLTLNGVEKVKFTAALKRLAFLGVQEVMQGVAVNLTLDKSLKGDTGSYQFTANEQGITILANDNSGLFYGLQSIAALVSLDKLTIPHLTIEDEPHYQFRSMMVDVARNFHSKQFIFDLLDQMAAYKLNKFHLHLGDDEAWRLEINDLPELTDISSKRCLDLTEQRCLLPQLGAGVDPNSSVNGYYSKQDYKEILQYASERFIQVIPSLDMPGHSRSSIVAMKARYNKLMAQGDEQGAKQFLLHDQNDTTVYSSVQYYNDNTINACMESSYDFIAKVMDEVKVMHSDAGHPLTRYHIGADETAGAWVESPICKTFIAENDLGITKAEELGAYFVERVAEILSERDIETAGWNDGMMHTNVDNMPEVVQANSWGIIYWQGHQAAHKLANQNWEIVVSTPDVTYFDFPYEPDPKEHGYYWASRHSNTEKLFQFMPDNLPVHAEFWLDREDKSYSTDDTVKLDEQGMIISGPLKSGRTFAGIQGQLWSENTRNDDLAEYKIFPRLFALAERAWHKPEWVVPYSYSGKVYSKETNNFTDDMRKNRDEQWANFANIIANKELAKLDKAHVFYRIPTVGAKMVDAKLMTNTAYPGLYIEYKLAGKQWQAWTKPVSISGDVEVRARSIDSKRAGRSLFISH